MGRIIGGINISYDYEELLTEFKSDVLEFGWSLDKKMQILRDKNEKVYQPIIDYYVEEQEYLNVLKYDFLDDDEELEEKYELAKEYNKIKNQLEQTTVREILEEMEEMNRIF